MEAIVEYNYMAQEPDELTLRKGDVIKDIKVIPGGWWEGTLKDKRGMFPDNFVKARSISPNVTSGINNEAQECNNAIKKDEISLRNGTGGRKWCKVLYSYEPCNEDELPLIVNDTVEFIDEVEEGWWSGRLRGRVGVFPSNFVSPPTSDESDKQQNKERNSSVEYCRVLFPYTAANEDELTLIEDEIVTVLTRDAPDKGWWKGSLRGKIGLFPDNFVKIIDIKMDTCESDHDILPDINPTVSKINESKPSSSSHTGRRVEKAHARKNLESNASYSNVDQKNAIINHSTVTMSLKRLMERNDTKIIDNADTISKSDLELDGVERGENIPLLHLTASRAKAPRRRLPSSHHVRNQIGNVTMTVTTPQTAVLLEETVTNGSIIDAVDQSRDDVERLVCKTRKKVPWIEELKLNQKEKRKIQPIDKPDKPDTIKKERNYGRSSVQSSSSNDLIAESCNDNGDERTKDKEDDDTHHRIDSSRVSTCSVSPTTARCNASTYVPYHVYCQLLDRVSQLEERQTELQKIVARLSEQLNPDLINVSAINNDL